MKILMVTSSYPKFPGDVTAPFIESIALSLVERGHAVDVVLPFHPDLRRDPSEAIRFFPYKYAPTKGLNVWGYAQSLESDVKLRKSVYLLAPVVARALRRTVSARLQADRYDVVHHHWVIPNAGLVADVVDARGVPQIISLHGSDVSIAERFAPARALAKSAFRSAGAVTACSGDLARRAIALGAPAKRTRTIPYGVDTEAFRADRKDSALKDKLGLPRTSLLVLAVGRLVEKKGFRHLIDAAARTKGVFVAIAGDGDLRDTLQRQIHATGAPAKLLGALQREALAAAIASADIVAVPSVVDRSGNVDGLPNTLLEALASGKAVVASHVAGIPDVVEDGRTAVLVPPADPVSLSVALARLRDNPEERRSLGLAARSLATSRLTWPAAARSFEECYAFAQAVHGG